MREQALLFYTVLLETSSLLLRVYSAEDTVLEAELTHNLALDCFRKHRHTDTHAMPQSFQRNVVLTLGLTVAGQATCSQIQTAIQQ